MKRTVLGVVVLVLVSVGILTVVLNVQLRKALSGGTIYINSDGSISPLTANITTCDRVTYTFTGNNYLPIVVERNNTIINGNRHMLDGAFRRITRETARSGVGFNLSNVSNVTVKNTTITHFWNGIWLYSSSGNVLSGNNVTANSSDGIDLLYSSNNNVLSGNNVTANGNDGIYLYSSSRNVLSGNNVTSNAWAGIELKSSSRNVLSGNNVTSFDFGISLTSSSGNVLSGNVLLGNVMARDAVSFSVWGRVLGDFVNNVTTSNTVDGKPIYYLMNQSNIVISPKAYAEIGYLGLVNCINVTVQGLTLTRNGQGLLLAFTNSSRIANNTVTNSSDGIALYFSSGNALSANNVTSNWDGIVLYSSSGNVLSGNNVTASYYGIRLDSSSGNRIFHNNFLHNTAQAYILYDHLANIWDDGYPSGGNYWSNYNGTDKYSGPYQNITGSDSIGDTPYVIDANNTDRYPLMAPFNMFDAGTWNGAAYNVDVVSNSTISHFSFNSTQKTITFNVTGPPSTTGFCRVTIPNALLGGTYTVSVNGLPPLTLNERSNGTYTFLYFTYHNSTQQVNIIGTTAVLQLW